MRSGHPLDDDDQLPWPQAVARWTEESLAVHEPGIITYSNLKRAYLQITIGSRQRSASLSERRRGFDPCAARGAHAPFYAAHAAAQPVRDAVKTSTGWLSPSTVLLPKR
jgi:hypothetical protein